MELTLRKKLWETGSFPGHTMTLARSDFLHGRDAAGTPAARSIDDFRGYIRRTPDHDARVQDPRRPLSPVVDLYKGQP